MCVLSKLGANPRRTARESKKSYLGACTGLHKGFQVNICSESGFNVDSVHLEFLKELRVFFLVSSYIMVKVLLACAKKRYGAEAN